MCYVYITTPMYTLYIYVCCIHGCIHGFTFMYTPQPGSALTCRAPQHNLLAQPTYRHRNTDHIHW